MNGVFRKLKLNSVRLVTLAAIALVIAFVLSGGLQAVGRLGAKQVGRDAQILFNPDDVFTITWQVGSFRKTLTRDSNGWRDETAAVRPEQIQKMLIALAMATSDSGAFVPFSKINGTLTLKDGSTRRFKWNGSVFKWTEGPQADTGGIPNTLLERVLESGEFVSTAPHVSWCKSRVKEVRVESETLNFIVRAGEQGSWLRSGLKENEVKIDPTAMEKWLSQHCEIDGSFWKQRGLGDRTATPATFKFELQDGTQGSWDFSFENGLLNVDGEKAIVAPEFIEALAQIPKIP